MGIPQLLGLLEDSTRTCHVSEFRGRTAAVDTYCWLHKGSISCSEALAKGQDTDMYVTYCMKYVNILLGNGIKPIMVFDGRRLPAKKATEESRRDNRQKAKKQAMELLRLGKADEAHKFFRQCVDVTPQMALKLIQACRKAKVDCIVAPYESDAQIAYLNIQNIADFAITEDSDLLLFGCQKVLYKMDLNGNGRLVEAHKLNISLKMKPHVFTFDKFRHMCILSGCDYIDSLYGVGLKKALKFITMTAEDNPEIFLGKLPQYLNMRHLTVDDEYKKSFLTADATFLHQTVFDPILRKLVPLNDIATAKTKTEHCINVGDMFDNGTAFQLAIGNLNPNTLEKMDSWIPDNHNENSIWSNSFKVGRRDPKIIPKSHDLNVETPPSFRIRKGGSCPSTQKSKEELEDEYEANLQKELQAYLYLPKSNPQESSEEDTSKLSPVLHRKRVNPFLKKKQRSLDLEANENGQGDRVISRFFGSLSENTVVNKTDGDTENETEKAVMALTGERAYPIVTERAVTTGTAEAKIETKKEAMNFSERFTKKTMATSVKIDERAPKKRKLSFQPTITDMFKKMN